MEIRAKRQKRTTGAIVKISLHNGFHSYAQILDSCYAFYKIHTEKDLQISEIIKSQILFVTEVFDYAITKGLWQKIGNVPIDSELVTVPPQYIQDPINPDKFEIVFNNEIRPATQAECQGLEPWAVWEPEQIEKRLNDYFSTQKTTVPKRIKSIEPKSKQAIVKQAVKKTAKREMVTA